MTTRCLIHWDSLTGQWKPSVTVMMSQTAACLGKLLCSVGCPGPYESVLLTRLGNLEVLSNTEMRDTKMNVSSIVN